MSFHLWGHFGLADNPSRTLSLALPHNPQYCPLGGFGLCTVLLLPELDLPPEKLE